MKIVWQQNSQSAENVANLATIAAWWSQTKGKEVKWQQRLISSANSVVEIDWDTTNNFDEQFVLTQATLKGITIYWAKTQDSLERNITASRLELDSDKQSLDIYPQSQKDVVIRVSLQAIVYQKIELSDPLIVGKAFGDRHVVLFRDPTQKIELKIDLNQQSLISLINSLKRN